MSLTEPPATATHFWYSFERLMELEGGLVENPADPGGLTNYGISQRAYPHLDIRRLSRMDAASIYYRDYWLAAGIDRLASRRVQAKLLDIVVNVGIETGVRLFQRAVNYMQPDAPVLLEDGVLGERTRIEAHLLHRGDLVRALQVMQGCHYVRLVEKRPAMRAFRRGWIRRAMSG